MSAVSLEHYENVHTWDDVPTRVNKLHRIAQDAATTAIDTALMIGELLIEAKKKIGHGEWLKWLSENVAFGARTARNYMRVAKALPKLEYEDRQRVADLSFRDLLGALVSDTNKLAKLPEPGTVLEVAETEPLRRAVTRAATAEGVRKAQSRSVAPETAVVVAGPPAVAVPAWHIELRDQVLELVREAVATHGTDAVLDALNDAYCALQDGAE